MKEKQDKPVNVLCVDDDEAFIELTRFQLEDRGFVVRSCSNGREALELAREERPDLIITDILMPVMDGFQLCRETRLDPLLSSIPILVYSATYTAPEDRDFAEHLGAAFLVKPQSTEVLVETVEALRKDIRGPAREPAEVSNERTFLKLYNTRLVSKLEKKLIELEDVNRRLREQLTQQDVLLERVPISVYVKDRSGIFLAVSRSYAESVGKLREEMIGRTDDEVLPPDLAEAQRTDDEHVMNADIEVRGKVNFRPGGRNRPPSWWHTSKAPFHDSDGVRGLVSIAVDVSERKSLHDEALRKNRELESFIFSLSHELKTPLSVLRGAGEILGEDLIDEIPESARPLIDAIVNSVCRLEGSLETLLELSRVGLISYPYERVSNQDMVLEAMTISRYYSWKRNFEIRQEIEHTNVHCDRRRITEVLVNLLTNASRHGGDPDSPRIVIQSGVVDGYVEFSVEDNGAPISAEMRADLFQPFPRTGNDLSADKHGLGLFISRRVVERHNGTLDLAPESPNRFVFRIPLGEA